MILRNVTNKPRLCFRGSLQVQKHPKLADCSTKFERQSISYTLPSYRPKKRPSFTAKYFRLCYFKSFCLIFKKLYVLSSECAYLGYTPIYTDTGKGKLRLSFLKLIVLTLLPKTASSNRGERCIRYMAHTLQLSLAVN